MSDAQITTTEAKILKFESEKTHWPSAFRFLRAHRGHRPGNVHTFLGTAGGGKSTLVRSLLVDAMENMPTQKTKIGVWLSEESRLEFLTELYRTGYSDKTKLARVFVTSELDRNITGHKNALESLEQFVEENKLDLLLLDNLTTSQIYMDLNPKQQSDAAMNVKKICSSRRVPLLNFMHTSADVNDNLSRLINPNDVRGSKTIVNLTQFLYIMQTFVIDGHKYQTLRISKHRGQDPEHVMYRLTWVKRARLYCQDSPINFKDFKEAYKKRDTL